MGPSRRKTERSDRPALTSVTLAADARPDITPSAIATIATVAPRALVRALTAAFTMPTSPCGRPGAPSVLSRRQAVERLGDLQRLQADDRGAVLGIERQRLGEIAAGGGHVAFRHQHLTALGDGIVESLVDRDGGREAGDRLVGIALQ